MHHSPGPPRHCECRLVRQVLGDVGWRGLSWLGQSGWLVVGFCWLGGFWCWRWFARWHWGFCVGLSVRRWHGWLWWLRLSLGWLGWRLLVVCGLRWWLRWWPCGREVAFLSTRCPLPKLCRPSLCRVIRLSPLMSLSFPRIVGAAWVGVASQASLC